MPPGPRRDIVAIGGSAGSGAALRTILGGLPADFPASIIIATHMPPAGPTFLAETLSTHTALPVAQAVDGQPIERGHVYLAAADRHLLLMGGTLRLGAGPRENMARPAIDPLFRSAALSCGSRVVGVVLSGLLNDGAAGLAAIRQRGGTTVVQHPLDAQADAMPLAALEATEVDYVAPASGIAAVLAGIVAEAAGEAPPPTDALRLEVDIAAGSRLGSAMLSTLAAPSALSCPDCQGVLSEMHDANPLRYRCQIGHAFTAEVLAAQTEQVEQAIRVALRIMEERVTLVERMGRDAREHGRLAVAELYEARVEEYGRYAATLREAAVAALANGGSAAQEL